MVSIFTTAATVALALISAANAQSTSAADYYRPDASITSGFPGNTDALFRRSPCPALNTLANHGFLNRDGQNITKAQLREAIFTQFNLDGALADFLVARLPDVFDLNFLGTHNFIEHDASLSRTDSFFGGDQSQADPAFLQDFLSRASETKPFDVASMGKIRKDRLATSVATNANTTFGAAQVQFAFGEAALTLVRFGDVATETAPLSRVQSFFENEQFPADWTTPTTPLTIPQLQATLTKIVQAAN